MPPKVKLTKSEILTAAFEMVRADGINALNARSLAQRLECSTQPIFSNFANMNELHAAVKDAAYDEYVSYEEREISSGEYPLYKASGMAYIRFAKEEPELFKLIFMYTPRSNKEGFDPFTEESIIPAIMKSIGLEREEARLFHLEVWAFVHGIAVMFATAFYEPKLELVSQMMSDTYAGLVNIYKERKKKK